jgi:hypothetical protein
MHIDLFDLIALAPLAFFAGACLLWEILRLRRQTDDS